MKMLCKTMLLTALCIPLYGTAGSDNSDSTGLAGDNLDLYAVLELFKKAESTEQFEELINKESSQANNLDLNNDGDIDYIRVIDRLDSNVHAITLQVSINENESQDIAVITVEQKDKETAHLQIIGDKDLYGDNYIVEPFDNTSDKEMRVAPVVVLVNVWGWPCVRHVYAPGYKLWVSPWKWHHYPLWWKPWRPLAWHVYHPRVVVHHHHYHRSTVVRMPRAHTIYHTHRVATTNIHHPRAAKTNANHRKAMEKNVKSSPKKKNGNTRQKSARDKGGKKNGNKR